MDLKKMIENQRKLNLHLYRLQSADYGRAFMYFNFETALDVCCNIAMDRVMKHIDKVIDEYYKPRGIILINADSMTKEKISEFTEQWKKYNGVIVFKGKPNEQPITRL